MAKSTKNLILYFFCILPVWFLLLLTPTIGASALIATDNDSDYTISELSAYAQNNKHSVNHTQGIFPSDLPQSFGWMIFLIVVAAVFFVDFEYIDINALYYFYTRAPPLRESIFV
jgi:hypothetical protein